MSLRAVKVSVNLEADEPLLPSENCILRCTNLFGTIFTSEYLVSYLLFCCRCGCRSLSECRRAAVLYRHLEPPLRAEVLMGACSANVVEWHRLER